MLSLRGTQTQEGEQHLTAVVDGMEGASTNFYNKEQYHHRHHHSRASFTPITSSRSRIDTGSDSGSDDGDDSGSDTGSDSGSEEDVYCDEGGATTLQFMVKHSTADVAYTMFLGHVANVSIWQPSGTRSVHSPTALGVVTTLKLLVGAGCMSKAASTIEHASSSMDPNTCSTRRMQGAQDLEVTEMWRATSRFFVKDAALRWDENVSRLHENVAWVKLQQGVQQLCDAAVAGTDNPQPPATGEREAAMGFARRMRHMYAVAQLYGTRPDLQYHQLVIQAIQVRDSTALVGMHVAD